MLRSYQPVQSSVLSPLAVKKTSQATRPHGNAFVAVTQPLPNAAQSRPRDINRRPPHRDPRWRWRGTPATPRARTTSRDACLSAPNGPSRSRTSTNSCVQPRVQFVPNARWLSRSRADHNPRVGGSSPSSGMKFLQTDALDCSECARDVFRCSSGRLAGRRTCRVAETAPLCRGSVERLARAQIR
jgi:hypothetical protein